MRRDLAALVLLVLAHCALFEGGLGGNDGWGYFANIESLVEDRDLDLSNNLSPKGRDGVEGGAVGTADGRLGGVPHPTVPGRVVNSYPLGKALADLPFYLAGRAAGALLDGVRFPSMTGTPYEGMPPRRMICALALVLGSNLMAALGVALTFLALVQSGFTRPVAWAASALAFFASPMPFYAVNAMSHALATALAAAMLLVWVRAGGRPGSRDALVLGVLAGAAVSVRYASAGLVPILGLLVLGGPGGWRGASGRALAFAAGLAALSWIEPLRNWRELGHPMHTLYPALGDTLIWRFPGLDWAAYLPVLNLFIAPIHGILWWSPLLGVAMAGMVRLLVPGPRRPVAVMAWALLLGHAVLSGIGGSYHAGSGFSQRYLCEAMPCWALGLAWGLEAAPRRRLAAAAFALLAAWNYALFLLSNARLARLSPEGTRLGWWMSDYLHVFDQGMGPGAILAGVLASSVPGRLGGFWAALGAVAGATAWMAWLLRGRLAAWRTASASRASAG